MATPMGIPDDQDWVPVLAEGSGRGNRFEGLMYPVGRAKRSEHHLILEIDLDASSVDDYVHYVTSDKEVYIPMFLGRLEIMSRPIVRRLRPVPPPAGLAGYLRMAKVDSWDGGRVNDFKISLNVGVVRPLFVTGMPLLLEASWPRLESIASRQSSVSSIILLNDREPSTPLRGAQMMVVINRQFR